jgi:hypothetical protein
MAAKRIPQLDALTSASVAGADQLVVFDTDANATKRVTRADLYAASDGATYLGYLQSGSGAEPRTVQSKLSDVVSVKDFDAVGDGLTDDTDAIKAVAALGVAVYFPPGTYLCTEFSITPVSGTLFYGDGIDKSIIRFVSTTPTSKVDFVTTAGNIAFDRLTIYHDGPVSETAQIITLENNNIQVTNCKIKSNDSVSVDTSVSAFQFTDNNAANITVSNCEIHNVNRVILRSTSATGIVSGVLFANNYIHDLGQGGVQFNFPNGSIAGVQIIGNRFKDFYSGSEQIFCGGASLTDAVISNNVFQGSCNECVHLEEAGENVVVSNNVFSVDGNGVFLIDNNVGGVSAKPQKIIITGNVFTNTGTAGTNSGIKASEDGSGIESYAYVSVTDNIFDNYEYGAELGYGTIVVKNNTFKSCTFGIKTNDARPDIDGNVFENCGTGITALIFTGLVGSNTFNNCTTVANAVAADTTKLAMSGFKVVLNDDIVLPASTTTDVPLGISVGSRIYGLADVVAYVGGTAFRYRISELSFDGATVTDTQKQMVGSGTVAASGFFDSTGSLVFRLNNTGTQQTLRYMAVSFSGMWVSAD